MPDYDDMDSREEGRRDRDERVIDNAKARVATPGMLLILSGIFCYLFMGINATILITDYDLQVGIYEYAIDNYGKDMKEEERKNLEKQLDVLKNRDRSVERIQNIAGLIIGTALNGLIVLGGIRMRALKGYGIALTGVICAIIPCNSCCCVTMPIGIWALIILMNADVKSAFAMNALPPANERF